MALKRDKFDIAFSNLIRARDNYTCTKCGTYYPEGNRRGLDCSHYWGRSRHSVRWDTENADTHCRGCHQFLSANPHLFKEWKIKQLGEKKYNDLMRRANSVKKWGKLEKEEMYKELKRKLQEIIDKYK